MFTYLRSTVAWFFLIAGILVVTGCQSQSGSNPKADDKTMRVTVEVTGMS